MVEHITSSVMWEKNKLLLDSDSLFLFMISRLDMFMISRLDA